MKNNKKFQIKYFNFTSRGFTLVELLAVIVILAIILVIAVPKIMSVIEETKKATLESTAKMIVGQAEKRKVQNQVLGNNKEIKCEDIVKINDIDYESCKIEFDDKGKASVTLIGKGKFEGMAVCDATSKDVQVSENCANVCLVEVAEEKVYSVKDYNSCMNYLRPKMVDEYGNDEETLNSLCSGEKTWWKNFSDNIINFIKNETYTEEELVSNDVINVKIKDACITKETDSSCFEYKKEITNISPGDPTSCVNYINNLFGIESGEPDEMTLALCEVGVYQDLTFNDYILYFLENGISFEELVENNVVGSYEEGDYVITGYDSTCSKDVVLPRKINGIPVVSIEKNAFANMSITSFIAIDNLKKIGDDAFRDNEITTVYLPESVVYVGDSAFYENQLYNITIKNTTAEFGNCAFRTSLEDHYFNYMLPPTYRCAL